MSLINEKILKAFKKQGDTSRKEAKDIKIIAKFYNPVDKQVWYACEYDPDTMICFGFVSLFGDWNDKAGSFALWELEEIELPYNQKIMRDDKFPIGKYTLKEVMDGKRP
jgi:hypothetical protein